MYQNKFFSFVNFEKVYSRNKLQNNQSIFNLFKKFITLKMLKIIRLKTIDFYQNKVFSFEILKFVVFILFNRLFQKNETFNK